MHLLHTILVTNVALAGIYAALWTVNRCLALVGRDR